MSPISRIVSQTLRSRLSIQTFWFVVNIDEGFDKNKLEKIRSIEKTPVLKNSESIDKNYWWICIEETLYQTTN